MYMYIQPPTVGNVTTINGGYIVRGYVQSSVIKQYEKQSVCMH